MGCCSSADVKGIGNGITKVNFKKTKCPSIDEFFEKAEALQDELEGLTKDLSEKFEALAKSTCMNLEPGANLANMVRAMILVFGANVESFSDLGLGVKTEAPYIDINPPQITNGNQMKEDAIAYITLLFEAATSKIPGIVTKTVDLAG